jgi:hypothetical protein
VKCSYDDIGSLMNEFGSVFDHPDNLFEFPGTDNRVDDNRL